MFTLCGNLQTNSNVNYSRFPFPISNWNLQQQQRNGIPEWDSHVHGIQAFLDWPANEEAKTIYMSFLTQITLTFKLLHISPTRMFPLCENLQTNSNVNTVVLPNLRECYSNNNEPEYLNGIARMESRPFDWPANEEA
ncbi:hypothetical protein CEXT_471931 [Caerostris extrusa]|uniref:Uncharacterized protein n=1 Tax=Caerostris extrusa TaxID=172846 RepID=A0AAV4MVW1_CAEEX|nr:hypothetical protein CEXT_471931 [Caerostris extrusa]